MNLTTAGADKPARQVRSLRVYLRRKGETQKSLAARLGITQGHLSHLISGKRGPGLALGLRIHAVTGIPLDALLEQGK